jgi:hypothetical protein
MASLKGPGEAQMHDGSALRIGIVHARWNSSQSSPPRKILLCCCLVPITLLTRKSSHSNN